MPVQWVCYYYVHGQAVNSCLCVIRLAAYRLGSSGKAMPGVEMKIDNPNE